MSLDVTGPRTKLGRALRHIEELEQAASSFDREKPYELVIERCADKSVMSFSAKFDTARLNAIGAIIGDVVHNLRSALDHLAAVAIERSGGSSSSTTGFPICASERKFEKAIGRKLSGSSDNFKEFVRRVKPYRDGGDAMLVDIADLNNRDKHRSLVPSVAVYRLQNIVIANAANSNRLEFAVSQESVGETLFIATLPFGCWSIIADSPSGYALKFQQTGLIDGASVTETLKNMHCHCQRVIDEAANLAFG